MNGRRASNRIYYNRIDIRSKIENKTKNGAQVFVNFVLITTFLGGPGRFIIVFDRLWPFLRPETVKNVGRSGTIMLYMIHVTITFTLQKRKYHCNQKLKFCFWVLTARSLKTIGIKNGNFNLVVSFRNWNFMQNHCLFDEN